METLTPTPPPAGTEAPQLYVPGTSFIARDGVMETVYNLAPETAAPEPVSPASEAIIDTATPPALGATGTNPPKASDSPWEAPAASTRVPFVYEQASNAPYTSRLARSMDRVARFFTKSAEVTERGSEIAHRFGSFAGRVALHTAVELKTIPVTAGYMREQWQKGGETRGMRTKNALGRMASNIVTLKSDRVGYDEHLATRVTTVEQKQARRGEQREARHDFYQRKLSPEALAHAASQRTKEVAGTIAQNTREARAKNLSTKATLKNFEARLHQSGIDKNGQKTTKNMSHKIARKTYKARQMRSKAAYLQTKHQTSHTNPATA